MSFGHFAVAEKIRRMANSVDDEIVSFNSALKEVLKSLSEFNVSCIKIGTKRNNCYTGSGKGSTGRVAKWLWEKPNALSVGSYERSYDGETCERSCRFSAPTYCL